MYLRFYIEQINYYIYMKNFTFLFALLSFIGTATAQNTNIESRLYYQKLDNVATYGAGKYQLRYTDVEVDGVITKNLPKFIRGFAHDKGFTDSIPKINPKLNISHYYVSTHEKVKDGLWNNNICYFIYDKKQLQKPIRMVLLKSTTAAKSNAIDEEMLKAVMSAKYQKDLEKNALGGKEFDFLGRKIILDDECFWGDLGLVRCPTKGEMNWSLHRTLAEAQESVFLQAKSGEVLDAMEIPEKDATFNRVGDREIELIFEENPTKAREITYLLHYQKSQDIDKKLIVYYIATTVRGYHIACVLSYWDDSPKLPNTQLPAFISEFMQLK